jgi:hypothetical protein
MEEQVRVGTDQEEDQLSYGSFDSVHNDEDQGITRFE